jgi:hypothetical protein
LPYKKVEVRREAGPDDPARNGANAPGERETRPRWPLPPSGVGRKKVSVDDDLDVPDFLKS